MSKVQFIEMLIEEVENLDTTDDVLEFLETLLDEAVDDEYINGPEEFNF